LETQRAIHRFDPLFDAVFKYAKMIDFHVKNTTTGVEVFETSKNDCIAKLIQAHAKVVSLFIRNGHEEAQRRHDVPQCLPRK
jgi:hypothetical protein